MKETLEVINRMEADGVVGRYAIGGAVAALYYIEMSTTEDLDIFVSFDVTSGMLPSGLITLAPILSYLAARGYTEFNKEGVNIEGWPVQFLPIASELEAEALAAAQDVDLEFPSLAGVLGHVPTRILLPEHLIANALRVGRPKDHIRISQFLEQEVVDFNRLGLILKTHGLASAWKSFCFRTGVIDPCSL